MKYKVLKPLHHEGKDYQPGDDIDIDGREDKLEERLIKKGIIINPEERKKVEEAATKAAKATKSKGGKDAAAAS